MKRIVCIFLAVFMLLAVIAGCGGDSSPPATTDSDGGGDGGNDSGSETDTPAASGGELTFYSYLNEGESDFDVFKECVAAFERDTGINMTLVPAGRDVLTKVKVDLLAGNPPDLMDQDLSELSAALLGDEVLVIPLNDLLDGPGPDGEAKFRDVFSPGDLELYAEGETIYFIPWVKITSGFWYDKTMFTSNNLTTPNTWDEFITVCEALKGNGIPPLALDGGVYDYNAYYYYWAVQRVLGSGKFSEAAHDRTGAAWDDPGYLRAAEMVYELSKSGKDFFQDGYEGSMWPAAQSDFALGELGLMLCGSWIPKELSDMIADDFEFGFYPFPVINGGVGKVTDTESFLMGFAIPKEANNPDNASKFILYWLQKEWATKAAMANACFSARPDVESHPIVAEAKEFLMNSTSAHKPYDGLMGDLPMWWTDVFHPVNNSLTFGTITPEEFIAEIKALTIEYWQDK